MCVWGGGVEAITKLKGAGAYLHMFCLPWPVLYTVSLKQTPTAHRQSRPEIIVGRHLRASNEMIHGDFGIMILILRL